MFTYCVKCVLWVCRTNHNRTLIKMQILRPGLDTDEPESGFSRACKTDMHAGVEEHCSGRIFFKVAVGHVGHATRGMGMGLVRRSMLRPWKSRNLRWAGVDLSPSVSMRALGHITRTPYQVITSSQSYILHLNRLPSHSNEAFQ